jgi:tetratricopeptide (TPR) repeat protein
MEEAMLLFRQALELRPESAAIYRRLGMVLDRLGDRQGAEVAFEAALRVAPNDATARLLLGRLLLDQNQARAAELHLARAFQLDPKLANAVYLLSQAQNRLGKTANAHASLATFQKIKAEEKAEADTRNTSYNDERFMRALAAGFHLETATLCLQQRQFALAEAHLGQAVLIDPKEPLGFEMLAGLRVQAGRLSEAKPLWEALIALAPREVRHHVNLGTLLLQLQDEAAAVPELQRALELDRNQPEALNNLARAYLSSGRKLPEALELCRRLVELHPTVANYELLSRALFANQKTNEARAASAAARARAPENAAGRERLRPRASPP